MTKPNVASTSSPQMTLSMYRDATMNTSRVYGPHSEIFVNHSASTIQKTDSGNEIAPRYVVVVATPSEYRKAWYEEALPRFGMHVVITTTGVQCIEAMHNEKPDVLILELERRWNGPQDILRARNAIYHLQRIPVVLIARDGVSSDAYQLSSFVVQGFYSRMPSIEELSNCVSKLGAFESREVGK